MMSDNGMSHDLEHAARVARAALAKYFTPGAIREGWPVSIQIHDAANPASRKEVRERIGDLLGAHAAALGAEEAPEGMESDTVKTFKQKAEALYHALTGYQPSEDELSEMGAQ